MKNLDLRPVFKGIQKTVSENSPQILMWVGITCSVSAIVATVPATIKASELVRNKKAKEGVTKLSFWDTIKASWYCYIPTLVLGTVSVLCVTQSASVNGKRTAALAAAYQLSESTFKEYQQQVVEKIGDKKEQEVTDNVSKRKLEENPVSKSNVVITEKGNTLCYDTVSGRYFRSDMDKIKQAINELNRQMMSDGSLTLNELYDDLGLSHIAIGDDLGWTIERGFIDVKFSCQLAEDGTPCLVLDYRAYPSATM